MYHYISYIVMYKNIYLYCMHFILQDCPRSPVATNLLQTTTLLIKIKILVMLIFIVYRTIINGTAKKLVQWNISGNTILHYLQ